MITWGLIIMLVLLGVYLFDHTQRDQISGRKTTDEEDARERNPFIPKK